MESTDVTRLKRLLAELDRLCADAQQIRETINDMTRTNPIWPERRETFRPLEPATAHDLATPPKPEQSN